jgi:diguanylate cyclase (GGDEF)-like protein
VSTLLIVLGFGVLILLGAGLLLADNFARGMGAVSRAATGLAAGDLDQEVDVWSRDEMGRMAASFREMIAYHQRMAAIADAVAAGDLTPEVVPQSSRDRLGIALHGMIDNLRGLVSRLEQLAFHDPLTGLANRTLFLDRLRLALQQTEQQHVAVLFLDLDNFKVVNDSLGHAAGDDLLMAVALRVQTCVGPGDTVARFGGDEFTILLNELPEPGEAMAVAERIAAQLSERVSVGEHSLVVSVSVGIALGSAGQVSPGDLLRAADLALYAAKDAGKAQARVFDPAMGADSLKRLEVGFVGRRGSRAA